MAVAAVARSIVEFFCLRKWMPPSSRRVCWDLCTPVRSISKRPGWIPGAPSAPGTLGCSKKHLHNKILQLNDVTCQNPYGTHQFCSKRQPHNKFEQSSNQTKPRSTVFTVDKSFQTKHIHTYLNRRYSYFVSQVRKQRNDFRRTAIGIGKRLTYHLSTYQCQYCQYLSICDMWYVFLAVKLCKFQT